MVAGEGSLDVNEREPLGYPHVSNLAVFVKTDGYFDVLDKIYALLPRTESDWTGSYIRTGTLPFLADERVGAKYSEYISGLGRTMQAETYQVRMASERHLRALLLSSLDAVFIHSEFSSSSMLSVDFECISINNVSQAFKHEILTVVSAIDSMLAVFQFDGTSSLILDYVWEPLVLKAVAINGEFLTTMDYPPEPYELGKTPAGTSFISLGAAPKFSHPSETGRVHVQFDQYAPLVEERLLEHTLPPKFNSTNHDRSLPTQPAVMGTPSGIAIAALRYVTSKKPSAMDDGGAEGYAVSPSEEFQFPDPSVVERKVRDYCLAVGHESGKWKGFAKAGYEIARIGDAELLTSAFCSALFTGFVTHDSRTTADGSVQFTVDVLLPARRSGKEGGFVPATTAWILSQSKPISLSTAYVSGVKGELNPTQSLTAASFQVPEILWNEVRGRALEYGLRVRGSEYQVRGWLWIASHQPCRMDFIDYIRAEVPVGITRRMGGNTYLQVVIPGMAVSGATQMYGTLRQAQILLGIGGVHSRIGVYAD